MTEAHALAGSKLAGYRVQRLIGRGGMGEVYLAQDERLGRPVALKVLPDAATDDDRFRDQLLRESRLAASLDHPNVVPIYEAGEAEGRLFIAMRFVEGTDLKALLRREGALDPQRLLAIVAPVADALDAAHQRGLVHRDVKPSNVLLDQRDRREHPYLADFGLTQSAAERGPTDGQFMGSVDYVAPEQIRGDEVGGPADQYALGCLLFEGLTGTLPFRDGSDVAAIFAHLETPPPAASERRPALPRALDPVLAQAMAKEPADRHPSCAALVTAARDALGLAPPAPGRGRRGLLAALVVTAAALAGVAVMAITGRDEPAAATAPTGALVRLDPRTTRVVSRAPVPGHPGAVAATPGGVWMADFERGDLWRYQPATGHLDAVSSTGEPRDIAALNGKVYVASDEAWAQGVVARYDAASALRETAIDLVACALTSGEGVLWAAGCPYVQRLSTGAGPLRKVREVFLPFRAPATVSNSRVQYREMAVGGGALVVLGDALDPRAWKLDARTGKVLATTTLGFPPFSVAVAAGRAWITDAVDDTVVPLDLRTGRLGPPVKVGRGASGIAAGAGSLWVANTLDGTVSRIDPAGARVTATVEVGELPRQVGVGDGAIWVTTDAR